MDTKTLALPALLLGAVLIVVGLLVGPGSAPPASDALSERVAQLEQQVTSLQQEVVGLRDAATAAPPARTHRRGDRGRTTSPRGNPEVRDFPSGVMSEDRIEAALLQAAGGDQEGAREVLSGLVRDEIDSAREERREDRRRRMAERQERRLEQLVADVGLTDEQHEALGGLLADEREEVWVLFQAAREDHSFGEARDQSEELRAQTDERAASLLEEGQARAWEAMREEEEARRSGRH